MKIEPATISHAQGIGEVHVASWQSAYKGILPAALLGSLSVTDRVAMWVQIIAQQSASVWVAKQEEKVCGFISFGASRDLDASPNTAEIQAIYINPTVWSTGTGWLLMQTALEEITARHFTAVTLWVLADNTRAIRFYEKVGFVRDGSVSKDIILGGISANELRLIKTW